MHGGAGLLALIIAIVAVVVPLWKILPRAGLSPWWALVAIVPLGLVVLLWVLAFKRWPGDDGEAAHGAG